MDRGGEQELNNDRPGTGFQKRACNHTQNKERRKSGENIRNYQQYYFPHGKKRGKNKAQNIALTEKKGLS